jgi:site-specific DNA-methyltransferase (adenine-specific)
VKQVRHEWDEWTTGWLDQAWRVSGGHVGVFCTMANLPSLFDWIGPRPFRVCAWCKSNPRPQFNKRPAYGMEMFVVVGGVQPCAVKGKLFKDYIVTAIETRNKHHPYQKPVAVMAWAVNMVCPAGGTVLDPFMGGGSTGEACITTGRSFVGVERDEEYFLAAQARLNAGQK